MATTGDFSRGISSLAVSKWFGRHESKMGISNLDLHSFFGPGVLADTKLGTRNPSQGCFLIIASLVAVHKHSTLRTMWSIICRPFLPGYFLVMLGGERLKRLAPVSVQIAWTSIFFPTPAGPASSKAFTKGAFSWTVWEPVKSHTVLLLLSFKSCHKGNETTLPLLFTWNIL